MSGGTVEIVADGPRHGPRSRPSPLRARGGLLSRPPASHPRTSVRRTDNSAAAILPAVLEERARIARELHDSVSQTLYAIALGAARARALLQQNERTDAQRLIDDVVQLADAGQCELRALLTDIRSNQLTAGGLIASLANLAADARTRHGLDIRVSISDEPDLAAATSDGLLMIVREAIRNVVRHSAARHVDVVLECAGGQLTLLITDDGRGFDPTISTPGHFGLQSMRERAIALGGTLALVSATGSGTQLRVSLPLEADADG